MRFAVIVTALAVTALTVLPAGAEEIDEVNAAFHATYHSQCDLFLEDNGPAYEPDVFAFSYRPSWDADGDPREIRLYQYRCLIGAYNVNHVFFQVSDDDGIIPLHFSVPKFDVTYEGGTAEPANDMTPVEEIVITGFGTSFRLVNAEVDEAAGAIRNTSYWRGLGDASSSAEYRLIDGDFALVTYDVDATYDGEINPLRIWDTLGLAR